MKRIIAKITLLLLLAPLYGVAAGTKSQPPAPPATSRTPTITVHDDDEEEDDDDDDDAVPGAALGAKDDDDRIDPYEIMARVTLASDYMLRGLTQTNHQPAMQGALEWEHPLGFYLALGASNVRFAESPTSIETDWAGGYKFHFTKDLSTKLGIAYYWFYDDHGRSSWDVPLITEWKGFALEISYSPRWEGQNHPAWYVNLGWEDVVIWKTTVGAYAGYSFYPDTSEAPKYADFKLCVSHEFLGLDWEVAGIFTKVQKIIRQEEIIDPEDPELTQTVNHELTWGGSRAGFSVSKSF